jgi:subtilisin family serine protease
MPILVRAFVGVAEESIDRDHPVFAVAGDNAFDLDTQRRAQPATTLATADLTKLTVRDAATIDHGTMVASIIAGRQTLFKTTGLAPTAMLFALPSAEPAIGEAIRKAFLDHHVRIFNISAHYGRNQSPPQTLDLSIRNYVQALFVVAAGNDWDNTNDGQVCVSFQVYPGCWADRRNVLVVTATDASGNGRLLPAQLPDGRTIAGANWHPTQVHVAAPGEGFYAAAAGGAYAPARGSSFATPMVTATAAMLFAQGVTDPWLIKQRIIATADVLPGLAGKVLGGRLNVARAVSLPNVGILVAGGNRRLVRPLPGATITVRDGWGGPNRAINVERIRRLERRSGAYRVVFLDDNDDLKIMADAQFPNAGSSRFRYALVEELEVTSADGQSHTYLVQRGGIGQEGKFVNFDDYVGPVL